MKIREEEDITQYLDSTYLKTGEQADITDEDNYNVVIATIQEAIDNNFKLVMIRPEFVSIAREMIDRESSNVLIGTVIDFPGGGGTTQDKIKEAQESIDHGVDVFVKTSTGFYNGTGANVDDVSLMKSVSGDLPVKASGGVQNRQDLDNMVKAGATRVGTSKAYDIYKGKEGNSSGY